MEASHPDHRHERPSVSSGLRRHVNGRFYFLHSALVFGVVVLGVVRNGDHRKYISVDPRVMHRLLSASAGSAAVDATSCRTAYANVLSSAIDEELAAVCCAAPEVGAPSNAAGRRRRDDLCDPRIPVIGVSARKWPFATRLHRPTEAWLLPLSPILLRLVGQLLSWARSSRARDPTCPREATPLQSRAAGARDDLVARGSWGHAPVRITLQRLLIYVALIAIRTFGLYVGADVLEGYVLSWVTGNTPSTSDGAHGLTPGGDETECWYKGALKGYQKAAMEGQPDCYGRPFDFSDHVVLFLAQYFPLFVMEMLFWYACPSTKVGRALGYSWALYFHLIVLHNLYYTAVYFHTPAETLAGYAVSLIIQLPVARVMCSTGGRVRAFIGLPSKAAEDKGD